MTEDVLVRLRQSLPGLRPSEQRIARERSPIRPSSQA